MNFELFIAKRILGKGKENISRPAIRIAIVSIALGLSVMILSISILLGFQQEIRNKITGFASHIIITSYDFNKSLESAPVLVDQPFYPYMDTIKGIANIQVFATKGGIIKTEEQMEGVILKGIGRDYDWTILNSWIVQGKAPGYTDSARSTEILISSVLAARLGFSVGDDVRMYFVTEGEKQPRGRKFNVAGIYSSGLQEFDAHYIYGDIRQIQRLNNWNEDMVSGFEVTVDNFDKVDEIGEKIKPLIGYHLKSETVKQSEEQLFSWLELQDMNVVVIIVLMLVVTGFSMISALLIIILEKTSMIGILKALGSLDQSIERIFFLKASYIIGIGLLFGNIIGLGLSLLQYHFSLIPLPEESYYVSTVPIKLSWVMVLGLNVASFAFCFLLVMIASGLISRITPVRAIRFK